MSEKEKRARIEASQEELRQHRTPAGEEDKIAIGTMSISKNSTLEILNSREAIIEEKEETIKVKDGGYKEVNNNDKDKSGIQEI